MRFGVEHDELERLLEREPAYLLGGELGVDQAAPLDRMAEAGERTALRGYEATFSCWWAPVLSFGE